MKPRSVHRYAMPLPEVSEVPHFQYRSYRVRGRILATPPPGEEYLHVFPDPQTREMACALCPEFMDKPWWGKKVAGIRINRAAARPDVVREMLLPAWKNRAPKLLVQEFLADPG